jgi:acyl-CoA thioester hydrolase
VATVSDRPFRVRFRVRYHECDGQNIVFNARWGEWVDVACTEYCRAIFGAVDAADWRLVRQLIEWRRPAHFDDVIEARVATRRIGTTSFVLTTTFVRPGTDDGSPLAEAETMYVVVERGSGTKQPISDAHRAALVAGAPDLLVDQSGTAAQSG